MITNSTAIPGGETTEDVVFICEDFNFSIINGALFILIFLLSVLGNILLLCMLAKYENLNQVTNIFILNLACSDLVFAGSLPFWAVYHLHHWVFGDFLCKFLTATYFVGLYSSVIILTALTVDRFSTVVLQFGSRKHVWRKRFAIWSCAAAWIVSVGTSLRDAFSVQVELDIDIYLCEALDDPYQDLSHYLQVSLLFFLPLAIIIFCYSAIIRKVLQASNRKWQRTVFVVLCIVVAFFVCWAPHNILLLIIPLYKPKDCQEKVQIEAAFNICRILAYFHCCLNPLIYMASQKARKHLLHLFGGKKERRQDQEKDVGRSNSVTQHTICTFHNSTVMLDVCTNKPLKGM